MQLPGLRVDLSMWAQAGGMDSHLPKTHPQLLSQAHQLRAPGSPNTPAHTCSKQGTHMLNSGSPRYKRLGVGGWEHLESRLLPKSIGICVSLPRQAPISGCGGHNSRCGYPPPQLTHIGLPPFPQPQPAAGAGGPLPLAPSWPPPTGAQPVLPPSQQEEGTCAGVASPTPSTEACSIVGGGVAAQEEKKAGIPTSVTASEFTSSCPLRWWHPDMRGRRGLDSKGGQRQESQKDRRKTHYYC